MIYRGVKYEMYGGDNEEEYNALDASFCECSGGRDSIYEWIENTPKTSMIVCLVNKLKDMGYQIIKQKN